MTTQAALPQALFLNNSKDSRWLTLEVCREFQRNRCTRTEEECKFAHPPPHVDQQNGRVMCCFDSIKGKCQRKEPPCKYLHPPQHLKEQLLQNGRQNLAIKYHWNQVLAQNQLAQMPTAAGLMPGMGLPGVPGMPAPMALDAGGRYLNAAAANAGVLQSAGLAGFSNQHTAAATAAMMTPSPYLYNQYAAAGLQQPGAHLAGMGQLPLQFAAVSQGAAQTSAAPATSAAAATLDSQALGHIPSSSTASSTPSMNGQKAPRADRLEPQQLIGLGQAQPGASVASMAAMQGMPAHMSQAGGMSALNMASYQNAALQAAGYQTAGGLTAAGLQAGGLPTAANLAGAGGLAGAGLAGAYQSAVGLPTSSPANTITTAASPQDAASALGQAQAKKRGREEELLLHMGMPGMGVPVKRQALDATKAGIPMFNPAYQQLAYAQQQPAYVPVSFAGHPAGVQRL